MNKELLLFEVAGSYFSIPLEVVEEVVPSGAVTKVPNSPPFFLGLTAVRGKIMGVIDAAKRYGIGPGLNSHFMVCRVRGNLTAVAIDRPLVAGAVPIRPLEEQETQALRAKARVDAKFLKSAYELLEVLEEGGQLKPTGTNFSEIDPDLFVSAEMASRVGEV